MNDHQLAVPDAPDDTQIDTQIDTIQGLEARFQLAIRQRELLETYITGRLIPDRHYYSVAGGKPSLTKDGAELICLPHNYKPLYAFIAGPEQPPPETSDSPYQLIVRCRLMNNDRFGGEGMGSASSHVTNSHGERKPRQPDIGLRHNATLKMAQKSAYIAATLNATAASQFFTQDMEDARESSSLGLGQEAPMGVCLDHNTPFVFKEGTSKSGNAYAFWACGAKVTGGGFCQQKPDDWLQAQLKSLKFTSRNQAARALGLERWADMPAARQYADIVMELRTGQSPPETARDAQTAEEQLDDLYPTAAAEEEATDQSAQARF